MTTSLMVENAIRKARNEPLEMVVDLGYLNRDEGERTVKRAEQLKTFGIGKRNFSVEAFSRLLVRIPPSKRQAVLAKFSQISAPGTYYGATHAWREPTPTDGTFMGGSSDVAEVTEIAQEEEGGDTQ